MVCNTCNTSIVGRVVTGRNTPGTAIRYRNNIPNAGNTYQTMGYAPNLPRGRYEGDYGLWFVGATIAAIALVYLLKKKR